MTLEALRKDMVAAMKAKDKTTKDAVSSLVSAVKKAAIDEGCREDVPEALVDRVILKEMKTVKEQLDTCPESRDCKICATADERRRNPHIPGRKICRCACHQE